MSRDYELISVIQNIYSQISDFITFINQNKNFLPKPYIYQLVRSIDHFQLDLIGTFDVSFRNIVFHLHQNFKQYKYQSIPLFDETWYLDEHWIFSEFKHSLIYKSKQIVPNLNQAYAIFIQTARSYILENKRQEYDNVRVNISNLRETWRHINRVINSLRKPSRIEYAYSDIGTISYIN
jgi:hypothetical protein